MLRSASLRAAATCSLTESIEGSCDAPAPLTSFWDSDLMGVFLASFISFCAYFSASWEACIAFCICSIRGSRCWMAHTGNLLNSNMKKSWSKTSSFAWPLWQHYVQNSCSLVYLFSSEKKKHFFSICIGKGSLVGSIAIGAFDICLKVPNLAFMSTK